MRAIFLIIFLGLIGCATTPTTVLNGSLVPPSGTAYAVVSVTGFSVEPNYTHLEIQYRSLDNANKGSIHVDLMQDTIFSSTVGGATTGGKVALLRLPPGRYRFERAYGSYTDPDEGGKKYFFPLASEFTLGEKETVYLGEMHLDLSLKPKLTFSDQQMRDFAHVQRIWQIKDLTPIKKRLLESKSS